MIFPFSLIKLFSYWFVRAESFHHQIRVSLLRDSHNIDRMNENPLQLSADFNENDR